ncbi:MAG TPA: hypothetical protein VFL83_07780 [Anaeromyxobacter sp.]|nr:hypothetical protein [Anaeromyxobacter sp.]
MRLIDDQELEPVAEPVHASPAALERRDGDRLDTPFTVAEAPDRTPERGRDLAYPLREEHACRDEGEGRPARASHRRDRKARLAAAGGEDHDAAPARLVPRPVRRVLVRAERQLCPGAGLVRRSVHLVREVDAAPRELVADRGVMPRWGPKGTDPWIPKHSR